MAEWLSAETLDALGSARASMTPHKGGRAHRGCRRDLALLTLAVTSGLRLRELVGLNVGDVMTRSGEVAWRVDLPKKITERRRGAWPFSRSVPEPCYGIFLAAKRVMRESMALKAPLFRSSYTRRLRLRRFQVIFGRCSARPSSRPMTEVPWRLVPGGEARYPSQEGA
jgi:site-specific recombinase XerC